MPARPSLVSEDGREQPSSRRGIWIALLALGAAYFAYPYVTLYRLDRALERGDARSLGELIDWPSVREQLKNDVAAVAAAQARQSSGAERFGATIAAMFGPYAIDAVGHGVLSPAGLISWYDDGRRSGHSGTLLQAISYAFFRSPTRFDVAIRINDPQHPSQLRFEMRLQDLEWRVHQVIL